MSSSVLCPAGSLCTKQFSSQEQSLQRLCVGQQCQCMTGNCCLLIGWAQLSLSRSVSVVVYVMLLMCCCVAACAAYRGKIDATLTADKRTDETCKPHIKYGENVIYCWIYLDQNCCREKPTEVMMKTPAGSDNLVLCLIQQIQYVRQTVLDVTSCTQHFCSNPMSSVWSQQLRYTWQTVSHLCFVFMSVLFWSEAVGGVRSHKRTTYNVALNASC